ncbi:MAG: response regulator [Nitrospirota bacterium]
MKGLSILIVDDVPFMRQFIRGCLHMSFPDCRTDEAGTGTSAREKMEQGSFDIVLCDWELPDVKGHELLMWLRSESNTKSTPFIMVTGNNTKEHIVKARELGVTDYIIKPVNCSSLEKKIIAALKPV